MHLVREFKPKLPLTGILEESRGGIPAGGSDTVIRLRFAGLLRQVSAQGNRS
jgi:hypothetical protein